ncbi:ABC-type transport system involved in multi-copper enzyme maturation permease subunit [Actinoalloteichus hoggarensis]|uniref:ABC-2 family transporter protein n=1 Tax=Actinoalloteichus hoggarensis TaxID=1470176 RepID=A0A221WAL9_9PSEU|nr:hypothetical protein [Actinoalloteichus hoggarensis]ASO22337.1 ABC-2 family transporter protein [Actinoalloteichus hoggarensis]MBB5923243.1 ABC-type transport system involved in multi-copper enzyme maturation permease subunit [Actinoalloteichus hoggarensis]
MFWLVWRRNRVALLSLLIMGGLLSTVLLGAGLAFRAAGPELARCLDELHMSSSCFYEQDGLLSVFWAALSLDRPMVLLPAVLAMTAGAPLVVREFHRGRHQFLWTQERTREQWFAGTVAVMFGAVLLVSLTIAASMTFWKAQYSPHADIGAFHHGMLVLPARTLFLTALCLLVSTAMRRRVIGVVTSLVAAWGLVLATPFALTVYTAPETMPSAEYFEYEGDSDGYSVTPVDPSAFYLGTRFEDDAGHRIPDQHGYQLTWEHRNADPDAEPWSLPDGLHEFVSYHPADRYWLLQSIEAGVLLVLGTFCVGGTVWLLRRRTG